MANHQAINSRAWARLEYNDPMSALYIVRSLEVHELKAGLPVDKRIRKGKKHRKFNEMRQGCLFALGYQLLHSSDRIEVAWADDLMDADVIFRIGGKSGEYIPVQLKEVPSERFNGENVLQAVLDDLAISLVDSANTLVGVYLTRRITPDYSFTIPLKLKVKALHLFGGIDATAWNFAISPDILAQPSGTWMSFSYPWPEGGELPPPPFEVKGGLTSRIDPMSGEALNS